jgi:hypothetical protein
MPARNGRTRALVSPAHPTPAKTGVLPETPNEISQDDQKGRPARPQAKPTPQVYPLGYIEDVGETRTKLAAFFIILLKARAGGNVTIHRPKWMVGLLRLSQGFETRIIHRIDEDRTSLVGLATEFTKKIRG